MSFSLLDHQHVSQQVEGVDQVLILDTAGSHTELDLFVSWPVPQKVTGALFSRAANCERQSAGSRRSVHGIGRFKVLSAT